MRFPKALRLRFLALLAVVVTTACGGGSQSSTPTSPTVTTPAPPPLPSANIVGTGQSQWAPCLNDLGPNGASTLNSCVFSASIQNTGVGCANNTSVVVRFVDASGNTVGSDVQMGATGGLAARLIRPNEVVALLSSLPIPAATINRISQYRLIPAWTNVPCA
jgi:hypothetical protein